MSLKQSLKLVIENMNNEQQYMDKYSSRNSPTKKISFTDDYDSMMNLIISTKRPCARCNHQQAVLQCLECNSSQFCQYCSNGLHQMGKFVSHHQNLLPSTASSQNKANVACIITDRLKIKQNNAKSSEIQYSTINISQGWDKIISQISLKFQQIINILKDKQEEIISKLHIKKGQQIANYTQMLRKINDIGQVQSPRKQKTIKKYFTQKTQYSQIKLTNHPSENESIERKIDRQYKIVTSAFQQIQNSFNKIQLRNILVKVNEQIIPQTVKKPMKSSLILVPPSNSTLSPYTKTPTHKKSQLSLSTIQCDLKDKYQKLNKDELNEKLNAYYIKQSKESKMLNKVRSQKLFCKSPNSNLHKVNKQKASKRKQVKLEQ